MKANTPLSLLLSSSFAFGQGGVDQLEDPDKATWLFGVRVNYRETAYRDIGPEWGILPYVAYQKGKAHIGFDRITYELATFGNEEAKGSLSAMVRPRTGRPDPNDDAFFGADRDFSIDAGLRARIDFPSFYFRSTLLADVTGKYDGFSLAARIGNVIPVGEYGSLDLSIGAAYFDENLSEYLFGVSAAQATPTFGIYDADATWRATVNARFIQPLSQTQFIVLGASLNLLDSGASNSTLLDDDKEFSFFASYGWRF